MKKLFSVPNILTAVRIAGAVCLLFAAPLSVFFYAVYTVSGVSDALDGGSKTGENGRMFIRIKPYSAMLLC